MANSSEDRDLLSARSGVGASWTSVVIATVALMVSGGLAVYEIWTARTEAPENIVITIERYFGDYSTEVNGFSLRGGPSASVGVYWSVFISNNGDKPVSLVSYDVMRFDSTYSTLDQGLFEAQNFRPLFLPITIESGHARRLLIRTGLLMPSRVIFASGTNYKEGDLESIEAFSEQLYLEGMDLLGNDVRMTRYGVRRIVTIVSENRRDETFLIAFETGILE